MLCLKDRYKIHNCNSSPSLILQITSSPRYERKQYQKRDKNVKRNEEIKIARRSRDCDKPGLKIN